MATTTTESSGLLRRGLRLEYATLAWNVLEAGLVAIAAISARSVALTGGVIIIGYGLHEGSVLLRNSN